MRHSKDWLARDRYNTSYDNLCSIRQEVIDSMYEAQKDEKE